MRLQRFLSLAVQVTKTKLEYPELESILTVMLTVEYFVSLHRVGMMKSITREMNKLTDH